MNKFLLQFIIFISLIICSCLIVLLRVDGYTDPFYLRFTSGKQSNLILGTSRSAQGLQPEIFSETLHRPFFNYSFSVSHSPFGSVYLKSIFKKLDEEARDGIFIVTVDPWSISSVTNEPNDSLNFRERGLFLGTVNYVNLKYNVDYLYQEFKGRFHDLLNSNWPSVHLHEDGWLEVSIPMDSSSVSERAQGKIALYKRDMLPKYQFSELRLSYLEETIARLKKHGSVYLVRLPVYSEMLSLELQLMPEFTQKIAQAIRLSDGFLDFTVNGKAYEFTDGNHLYKASGAQVSKEIADWIVEQIEE